MRAISEIERRVLAIVEPEAEALGFDVVRVRLMGARTPRLQIMAERPNGLMDVEDCADLSRQVSAILDVEDPIQGAYDLEVSSPGIDRPLTRPKDFADWRGHETRVEIGMPIDGRRRFHGWIESEEGGVVLLKLKDGGEAELPVTEMTKARLVLTDALIEDAKARGQAVEADEDNFDALELEDEAGAEVREGENK